MPVVFKHPDLPDYFLERPDVTATDLGRIEPVLQPYENGRVLTFPNLKFEIDHDFWASLPTDAYPEVKKLPSRPPVRGEKDDVLDRRLSAAGLPRKLETELRRQITRVYDQVLPVYERLFDGYVFTRRQAVWRLNTIMNENMHVDTYKEVFPDHFARLFINLDTQPRIWHTSWPVAEIFSRHADKVPADVAAAANTDAFRTLVNKAAFGGLSSHWWDVEPRHVIYFQPGDCWAVDSRQVAHQIFYGRRALSVDFFVDKASMLKPNRHYLAMAERLRREASAPA
jgi:hypothetical protein